MEGKTIWLRPETKERLENIRGKRETFDEVVQRLCSVFETIKAIPDTLGPNHPITTDIFRREVNPRRLERKV